MSIHFQTEVDCLDCWPKVLTFGQHHIMAMNCNPKPQNTYLCCSVVQELPPCSFPTVWSPSSLASQVPLFPGALLLAACRDRLTILPQALGLYTSKPLLGSLICNFYLRRVNHWLSCAGCIWAGGFFIKEPSAPISSSWGLLPSSLSPSVMG